MQIRVCRIRCNDLALIEHFGAQTTIAWFAFMVEDLCTSGATYADIAWELGTTSQNVRNWCLKRCYPEGMNIAKVCRWMLQNGTAPPTASIPNDPNTWDDEDYQIFRDGPG